MQSAIRFVYIGEVKIYEVHILDKASVREIPISEKYLLTIKEASEYFNIGENKMYRIVNNFLESDHKFIVQNGSRTMINRKKFESFLDETTSI